MTLADIDAVAVTVEPGLIGALLTGCPSPRLACAAGKPLVPMHHVRGHQANYLVHPLAPFLALVVSGGDVADSRRRLPISGASAGRGTTRQEAFDKGARVLSLPTRH
ncbi:MAG: hypothetical protein ACLUFV_02880 [Acutalibacteraceae bacterium]